MDNIETAWVKPAHEIGGLDHLGVQAPCIHIYSDLLPGITNVTDRARYYSFYPWLLSRFEASGWIKSDQFSINPYIVLGPSLHIGNDYAGIFATAETGIELASTNKGLAVFIGYGKNMLFHPDHTNYIKGGIGYQF